MMKDEKELLELLDDAKRTFRVPSEPPIDAMWDSIAQRHFRSPMARRWRRSFPHWPALAVAMVASLVMGVSIGRFTAPANDATVATTDRGVPRGTLAGRAYQRAASEFLGQTALLLAALPGEARSGSADDAFSAQASQLLITTRLLLDSPAASDRRIRDLLEDLELVLAQVARLESSTRQRAEFDLITEALEQRDVVPRIRSVVANLSSDDN
jgi:hypothetical protein